MDKGEIKRREVEALKVYRVIEDLFYLESGTWLHNHPHNKVKLWPKYRIATSYHYPWLDVYTLKFIEKRFLFFETQKEVADKKLLHVGDFYDSARGTRIRFTVDCYHPGIWSDALLENADEINALANKKREEKRKAEEERVQKEKELALASIDY